MSINGIQSSQTVKKVKRNQSTENTSKDLFSRRTGKSEEYKKCVRAIPHSLGQSKEIPWASHITQMIDSRAEDTVIRILTIPPFFLINSWFKNYYWTMFGCLILNQSVLAEVNRELFKFRLTNGCEQMKTFKIPFSVQHS